MRDNPNESNSDRLPAPNKLHRSVASTLRQQLIDGKLAGGMKLPSLRDMASEFKVSTMTVRQAIRVLEKEGHLYRVSAAGTYVRHNTTEKKLTGQMVAFSAADLSTYLGLVVARGVQEACQKRGWGTQLFDSHFKAEVESRNIKRLPELNLQGAIICPICTPESIEALFEIRAKNLPFVLVDRAPYGFQADIVESDHERGAYQATEHLIKYGHTQVLILTPPPTELPIEIRIRGYKRALAKAGLKDDPKNIIYVDPHDLAIGVESNRLWLGGYQAILPVLKKRKLPLAVFAIENFVGWGVYQACRELGLRIPEDVSIVFFDDSTIARALVPPPTVVAQRMEEIGHKAVELLERRILANKNTDGIYHEYTRMIVDVNLIERQSVASPARK